MNDVELQILLDRLRNQHGVVGAVAGLLRGQTVLTAASGSLNLDTGVDATPDSVFQIGSVGKIFTATLVMQLVDDQLLDLDTPVTEYLPEFAVADSAATRQITPRMLLCHLSGMDGDFFPADDASGPSAKSYVQKMRLLPQLFPPGTEPMAYCNSGFVLAGRLVEVLRRQSWPEAIRQRILDPLGLKTAFADPREAIRFRCALGHVPNNGDPTDLTTSPATFLPLSLAAAGTVLSMSADNLLRFAAAHLQSELKSNYSEILSQSSMLAMQEPQTVLPDFSLPEFNKWGLGWMLGEHPEFRSFGHDGATLGQYSYLRVFPEHDAAIVLLANSFCAKMFLELQDELTSSLFGFTRPAELGAQYFEVSAARYEGTYSSLGNDHIVTMDGDRMRMTITEKVMQGPNVNLSLRPYRPDVFVIESDDLRYNDIKVSFLGDDSNGRAQFVRTTVRMAQRQH